MARKEKIKNNELNEHFLKFFPPNKCSQFAIK